MILRNFKSVYINDFDVSFLWDFSHALPHCLGEILQRVRVYENSVWDGTLFLGGDLPPHNLVLQQQKIMFKTYFSDTSEVTEGSLLDMIRKLNECVVWIPFSTKKFERLIRLKTETEGVRSSTLFAEKYLKYIDRVIVCCSFSDSFYVSKFNLKSFIKNLIEDFSEDATVDGTLSFPVMTDGSMYVVGVSEGTLTWFSKEGWDTFVKDVTWSFVDQTFSIPVLHRSLLYDETTLDHTVQDRTNIVDVSYHGFLGPQMGYERGDLSFTGGSFRDVSGVVVPMFVFNIFGYGVLRAFSTVVSGADEWLRGYGVPYGYWLWSVLKFHYGFSDEVCLNWLRFVVSAVHHANCESLDVAVFSDIVERVSGADVAGNHLMWRRTMRDMLEILKNSMKLEKSWSVLWKNKTFTWNIDYTFSDRDIFRIFREINNIMFSFYFESGVTSAQNLIYEFPYYSKNPDYFNCSTMALFFTSSRLYI